MLASWSAFTMSILCLLHKALSWQLRHTLYWSSECCECWDEENYCLSYFMLLLLCDPLGGPVTCRMFSKETKWSLSVLISQLIHCIPSISVCSRECGWTIVSRLHILMENRKVQLFRSSHFSRLLEVFQSRMPKSWGFLAVMMIICVQTCLVPCNDTDLDGTPDNVIHCCERSLLWRMV